jgi:hypothetical protein
MREKCLVEGGPLRNKIIAALASLLVMLGVGYTTTAAPAQAAPVVHCKESILTDSASGNAGGYPLIGGGWDWLGRSDIAQRYCTDGDREWFKPHWAQSVANREGSHMSCFWALVSVPKIYVKYYFSDGHGRNYTRPASGRYRIKCDESTYWHRFDPFSLARVAKLHPGGNHAVRWKAIYDIQYDNGRKDRSLIDSGTFHRIAGTR